jgi:hypothetical protein
MRLLGLAGLRGLEAPALVRAGVGLHPGFVGADAAEGLQAQEGLRRIGSVDCRMDHRPLPAAEVSAEKRIGFAGGG